MPIPIVDIGGEDRGVIVRQIGEACTDFGFFQVSGQFLSSCWCLSPHALFSLFDINCSALACVWLIGDQPWDWKGISGSDYGGGEGVLSHAD